MRKLIYGINLTADGCCDHTAGNAGKDIHKYFTDLMDGVDLIVYGRITYEMMVPFWPEVAEKQSETPAVNEFARVFSAIDKVVFSRTLEKAAENTTIISGNLQEEILKLKAAPGGKISIGGVNLPEQMIALGLVDEFHFVVHPVIFGKGRRLFEGQGMPNKLNLKLVESKVLESGCVALHYQKG